MLVKQFLFAGACMTLLGCTAPPMVKEVQTVAAISQPATEVVEPEEKPLETAISAELLYGILGGELSGQRGDFAMATAFYVSAAKRSQNPEIALRAVQVALYSKDIKAAVSVVNILLEGKPVSLDIARLALNVYLQAGDTEGSIQQALALLKEGTADKRSSLLALGEVISRAASSKASLVVIDGLIEAYPQNAAGYLVKSQFALHSSAFGLAHDNAKKSIELAPDWPMAYMQLAQIHTVQGQLEQARLVLSQATKRLDDRRLQMIYGQLLAKQKHFQDAEEVFLAEVQKDSENHEARLALGLIYLKLEQPEDAIKQFTKLFKAPSYQDRAAFYLGGLYSYLGRYDESVHWLGLITKGSLYQEARAGLAMSLAKRGELSRAREILQELRREYPKQSTHFYVLEGEILYEAAKMQDMLALMSHAIEEKPDDLVIRYARSIAAAELEKIELVEMDLQFILQKEPNNVNALNALGYSIATMTVRFEEAKTYLSKAMQLKKNDPAIMDSMGWLHYRLGQYEMALELLEKAYSQAPQPEIAFHLGKTLWMVGRKEEAKALWLQVIENHPNDKFSKKIAQKLQ